MDLRGALIEWAKDMSSKKHVFRIRTVTGNEFLLQSENEDYISDWYRTIKCVIDTLDLENPLNYPLVYSLRRTASAELSERKRVKNRIRKFISKRPPLQTLHEKGLIKVSSWMPRSKCHGYWV
ncbi:rho GTPase-activating protein 15-like [Rhincodon typus]|uniref:rho GTPase-activating protein 15-like n=1 Tax=Rhincodon typus TaxID=259920 RepID=UPI00202F3C14|nr:rho GTPase-activating protein 15-like [Rhincodon typus]